jgi:hypothetical protein
MPKNRNQSWRPGAPRFEAQRLHPQQGARTLKTSIMVAILTGHERHYWIHPDLMQALVRMPLWQMETGSSLAVTTIHGTSPVAAARNEAVEKMLQLGVEWLLQIDNDTVAPLNILGLLENIGDRKIVGCPTPMEYERGKTVFNVGHRVEGGKVELYRSVPDGWSTAELVGSGCLLVHRDVFLSLCDPWFEHRNVIKDRAHANEDFHFCEKAREKGFQVWINSSFICRHYHTVELFQMMNEIPQALEKYHQALSSTLGQRVPTPNDLKIKF